MVIGIEFSSVLPLPFDLSVLSAAFKPVNSQVSIEPSLLLGYAKVPQ